MNLSPVFSCIPMKQIGFIFILFLFGCHPEKHATVALDQISFKMTDASELFFKNIRKSEYQVDENTQAGIDSYLLKDLKTNYSGSSPTLIPNLLINWRQDMAYVMLSGDSEFDADTIIIDQEITIVFDGSNIKEHAKTSIEIYNAILDGHSVEIISKGLKTPFFESPDHQNDFRIVVFDYLRLVEIR